MTKERPIIQRRVRRIILDVKDRRQHVTFYKDVLGLPLDDEPLHDDTDAYLVNFDTGDRPLSLYDGGKRGFRDDARTLGLCANDQAATRDRLLHLGVRVSELREADPGIIFFGRGDLDENRSTVESVR